MTFAWQCFEDEKVAALNLSSQISLSSGFYSP